jgi:hypothetical protein
MFRPLVVLTNVLAVGGVVLCAIVHAFSFVEVMPRLLAQLFAVTLLAVFPLSGFAILLALRVGRTYGVRGSQLSTFIAQRAPKWLRRLGIAVFVYALLHFAFDVIGTRKISGLTRPPLMASAFVAWFYLWFAQVFTVGLRDPKILSRSSPG